ncbi:hypothetical protein KP79_PYT20003 [Mizuhopecten yessoensis]|uniref:Uncharacterized protein n=1 Tax=Mizuhopecten yessoensis TaxID=6573 RepID=A0A210PVQ7_MIZYE|nr:hypothetical protein KP79_PYT20003 [Mizuhopecten yessoensis]
MDTLIDSLLPSVWQEVSMDDRGDGFEDFFVNGNPNRKDENTLEIVISDAEGNAKTVTLKGAQPNKNPLNKISRCELKVDGDKNLIGMDLNGDVVVLKS